MELITFLFVLGLMTVVTKSSPVDYGKLGRCFIKIDDLLESELKIVNLVVCRHPSPRRISFVVPSLQEILDATEETVRSSSLYSESCGDLKKGNVTRQEIRELKEAIEELGSFEELTMKALACSVSELGSNGLRKSGEIREAYYGLIKNVREAVEQTSSLADGGAICTEDEHCGFGFCDGTCVCDDTFTGRRCNIVLDPTLGPCYDEDCKNGGKCIEQAEYTCRCRDFYGGENCEKDMCPVKRNICGVCAGGETGVAEDAGVNKCGGCNHDLDAATPDCNGDCGGTAMVHPKCGTCYGGRTGKKESDVFDCERCIVHGRSPRDCAGSCVVRGQPMAVINKCGVCVGGQTGVARNKDMDVCGVCEGDGTTCNDCMGVPNGRAKEDACGVCNGNNACVKVTEVKPRVLSLGSEQVVTVSGVGLTGDNSELIAKTDSSDPGIPLVIKSRVQPNRINAMLPKDIPAGGYKIYYRETSAGSMSQSEAMLVVVDPGSVAIKSVKPERFIIEKDGEEEITIAGSGFPDVRLMCLFQVGKMMPHVVQAKGSGDKRSCMMKHPRFGSDITVSLSHDGKTILGKTGTITAVSPMPVCKLGFDKEGTKICLTCDVPIATNAIRSAADIFVDASPLGSDVKSRIPKRAAKDICFFKVNLDAAGSVLLLKLGAVKGVGQGGTAASGFLRISPAASPARPDSEMEGPSTVGSCSDITLRHARPSTGRRGGDLIYTHSVSPSEGVTIAGSGTREITLKGTSPGTAYTVTHTVCNQARDCSTSDRVIRKKSNPAPEVTIVTNINKDKVRRSSKFLLKAKVDHPPCGEKGQYMTTWSTTNGDVVLGTNTRNVYSVKPNTLPLGETTFVVTVQSESDSTISGSDSITLTVLADDLTVHIEGGRYRRVGTDSGRMTLAARASDPDASGSWACVCDEGVACPGMEVPIYTDKVALIAGQFQPSVCEFTYTAMLVANRQEASESVKVEFVQGDICDVQLKTKKRQYSSSDNVLIVAKCKTDQDVTFDWFNEEGEGLDLLDLDTTLKGEGAMVDTGDYYQGALQILKGTLYSGSTYRFGVRVIYPNGEEAKSTIDVTIAQEIRGCNIEMVESYKAYDKISIETVDCEGSDSLEYRYFYGTDHTLLAAGNPIEVRGPSGQDGNVVITVVVQARETGERKSFQKNAMVTTLTSGEQAVVRNILVTEVDDIMKTGNIGDAAAMAGNILQDFSSSVKRRKRSADLDLNLIIITAAEDIIQGKEDGVDVNSLVAIMVAMGKVEFTHLTIDQKTTYTHLFTELIRMLEEEDETVPGGLPQALQTLVAEVRSDGSVDETLVSELENSARDSLRSGLELGSEAVTVLTDKVVKIMNTMMGQTPISATQQSCTPKLIPGTSLSTRFSENVVVELATYNDDVDPYSPDDLKDKKTGSILGIDIFDSGTKEKLDVSGLSEEAIICLPVTRPLPGYMSTPMYWDAGTGRWQTSGLTLLTPTPAVCGGDCNMVALTTSHFTEVSVFAVTDTNECLDGISTCGLGMYCVNSVGSFSCQCLPGHVDNGDGTCISDSDPCTSNPCNGGTCATDLGGEPDCTCTGDNVGLLCQYNYGTFDFSSATFTGSEASAVVQVTILRTGGHDGSVNIDLVLPVSGDTAQAVVDYTNVNGNTLTFVNGETSKQFDIAIVDDALHEGDQTFGLEMTVETADATLGSTVTSTVITITDDDPEVNECTSLTPPTCPADSRCVDTTSSYTCECIAGFAENSAGVCEFDPTLDRCDPNPCNGGTCTLTGLETTGCACLPGWSGTWCDADTDECTDNTDDCLPNADCTNTIASFTCACSAGYSGDGITTCDDIDECTTNADNCDDNAACGNTDGSFTCTCNAGYSGSGTSCSNYDECSVSHDNCDPNAACADNVGSFDCTCNGGYQGDGLTCSDIDECTTNADNCDGNAACANTDGSFTCTCNAGYSGSGTSCSNYDECSVSHDNCDPNAACADNVGSFDCTCNAGYQGDGLSCSDIDECTTNADNCDGNAACGNTGGSFTCTCNAGYSGSGTSCSNYDECSVSHDNCDPNAACADNVGSFDCTCNAGYQGDGLSCSDIDECTTNADNCDGNAACTNTDGSFTCTCNAGYSGSGTSCSNYDECSVSHDNCDPNAACADNVGSFDCTCNGGYQGDGVSCSDIDECTTNADNCDGNAACANTGGSFTCTCNAGYSGSGTSCSNYDECSVSHDNCDPNAACADNVGSFDCTCNGGYQGDGVSCSDIDECTTNADNCDGNAACANTGGSFTCTCNAGYSGSGTSCSNYDECSVSHDNCDPNAACADNVGSFDCTCNGGYQGDGVTCSDIDECTADTHNCHPNAACTNTDGSFTCACSPGYSGDGTTACDDIDECSAVSPPCDAALGSCANTDGSYTCSCSAGYVVNGDVCDDVDECTADSDDCDNVRGGCTNTVGSYTCSCNVGFVQAGPACFDIDECLENTDTCHDTLAQCTNVIGTYTCTCDPGYSGDGTVCTNIDECTVSGPCDPDANCADTPGSYTCVCNGGFTGDGMFCSDIDECLSNPCDPDATCTNDPGSYTCTCNAGYSGFGFVCTDINECLSNPCVPSTATCTNDPGSFTCACNPGYSGGGFSCSDIDECASGVDNCDPNAACADNVGSFDCTCNPGYSGDGVTCSDIDECLSNPCDPDATCTNDPGSFTCACNAGYSGLGFSCSDIDECLSNPCDPDATCTNGPGSFTCACNAGYSGLGFVCSDINECLSNPCDVAATCTNDPGSFTCACDPGYSGLGFSCTDIDECTDASHDCDADAICTNTVGSFTCACGPGYTGTGFHCEDIDECASNPCAVTGSTCTNSDGSFACSCDVGFTGDGFTCTDILECNGPNICHADATCNEAIGSYSCTCNAGYSGNGFSCDDIDECSTGADNCHTEATCTNSPGSFSCACDPGYSGDGVTCTNINECSVGIDDCHPNLATCSDTPGSWTCACIPNYSGDGVTCTDIDECSTGADNCHTEATCTNSPGSFSCACDPGYSGDGVTCTNINECSVGIDDCHPNLATCSDTPGSWTCACIPNYSGDGVTCTDIDECSTGADNCHTEATCTNSPGSFSCACDPGYSGDGVTCTDTDECSTSTDNCHSTLATCSNTVGSFTCACDEGYSGDGVTCTDVDECGLGTDNCHADATCTNSVGSFTCACDAGYSGDGLACTDINECTTSTDNCHADALCINIVGSFTCVCSSGFSGDGVSCTDINECTTNTDNCHAKATCTNTQGFFTCACNIGYQGNGITCIDIDECAANTDNCEPANAACTNTPGMFTCTCNAGYTGDGVTCTDIDECAVGTHNCHSAASCINNPGSFSCLCNPGYTGNGLTCSDVDECAANTDNCDLVSTCGNNIGGYDCTCFENYTGDGRECTQCIFDCANVCFGTATLDCTNVCSGGTTGVVGNTTDACGVCRGDGTECLAVTAVSPILVSFVSSQVITITGTQLSSPAVQCVVRRVGEIGEIRLNITNHISATNVEATIDAHAIPVGDYQLLCRVQTGVELGTSLATLTVYDTTASQALPACVIDGPEQIDFCSDLEVNGLGSTGGGIHGLTYTWSISPSTGLTQSTPMLGHGKWTGVAVLTPYTVSLQVCTVHSRCSTCSLTVSKSNQLVPTVTIQTTVDITAAPANTDFELMGYVSASVCAGASNNAEVQYSWTLAGPSNIVLNSAATSMQAYLVRAGDFPAGSTVTATLTVTQVSDPTIQAQKAITIVVASRPLQVIIDGGEERTVSTASGVVVFDGSKSYDPDSSTATYTYAWSSVRYNSAGSAIGSCTTGIVTNAQTLSLDSSTLTENSRCVLTLTVTSSTSKTASSSVTLNINAGISPVCYLAHERILLRPDDRYTLTLTCISATAISNTAWTSSTDNGATSLDLAAATEDQFMDSLPTNEYKIFLVIAAGQLKGGNSYKLMATVTDVNGGQSMNTVTLVIMAAITGGELVCPSSYVELNEMTVTVRNINAPSAVTYTLLVRTSTGTLRAVSDRQANGDFNVVGPVQYGVSGNVFAAEICVENVNDMCTTRTCTVPTVISAISQDTLVITRKADITRLRQEGRPLDALVIIKSIHDKTGDSNLIPILMETTEEAIQKRTLNRNSATTLLDLLTSVNPSNLNDNQFLKVTEYLKDAIDVFISKDKALPARYLTALTAWEKSASAASFSGVAINSVMDKAETAQLSGVEYGTSKQLDLGDSYTTIFNSVPGRSMKVKDSNDQEVLLSFPKSVRQLTAFKNAKIQVKSFKSPPSFITNTNIDFLVPIIEVNLFNAQSNSQTVIRDLGETVNFDLKFPTTRQNTLVATRCIYWDTSVNLWMNNGVQTGVQTSTSVQCKTNHLTAFTVIADSGNYSEETNNGWLVGVIIGVLALMILIIVLIIFIFLKYKKNHVIDISRPSSGQELIKERPGSGDGVKRNI